MVFKEFDVSGKVVLKDFVNKFVPIKSYLLGLGPDINKQVLVIGSKGNTYGAIK